MKGKSGVKRAIAATSRDKSVKPNNAFNKQIDVSSKQQSFFSSSSSPPLVLPAISTIITNHAQTLPALASNEIEAITSATNNESTTLTLAATTVATARKSNKDVTQEEDVEILAQVMKLNTLAMNEVQNGHTQEGHMMLRRALQIIETQLQRSEFANMQINEHELSLRSSARYASSHRTRNHSDKEHVERKPYEAYSQWLHAYALTLSNLGCQLRRDNSPTEALTCLQDARDVEIHLNGSASCATVMNLSAVLLGLGRAEEALPLARYCVEVTTHTTANDENQQHKSKNMNKAAARRRKQQQQQQQKHNAHSTCNNNNDSRTSNKDNGILRITALHNLAVTLAQQPTCSNDDQQEALAIMLRALREAQEMLGETHPTTLMLRNKCGMTEQWMKTQQAQSWKNNLQSMENESDYELQLASQQHSNSLQGNHKIQEENVNNYNNSSNNNNNKFIMSSAKSATEGESGWKRLSTDSRSQTSSLTHLPRSRIKLSSMESKTIPNPTEKPPFSVSNSRTLSLALPLQLRARRALNTFDFGPLPPLPTHLLFAADTVRTELTASSSCQEGTPQARKSNKQSPLLPSINVLGSNAKADQSVNEEAADVTDNMTDNRKRFVEYLKQGQAAWKEGKEKSKAANLVEASAAIKAELDQNLEEEQEEELPDATTTTTEDLYQKEQEQQQEEQHELEHKEQVCENKEKLSTMEPEEVEKSEVNSTELLPQRLSATCDLETSNVAVLEGNENIVASTDNNNNNNNNDNENDIVNEIETFNNEHNPSVTKQTQRDTRRENSLAHRFHISHGVICPDDNSNIDQRDTEGTSNVTPAFLLRFSRDVELELGEEGNTSAALRTNKARTFIGVRAQLRTHVHDATLIKETREQLIHEQKEQLHPPNHHHHSEGEEADEEEEQKACSERNRKMIKTRETLELVKAMTEKLDRNNALKYAYDASIQAQVQNALLHKEDKDTQIKTNEQHLTSIKKGKLSPEEEKEEESKKKEAGNKIKVRRTVFKVDLHELAARAEAEKRAEELQRKKRAEEQMAAAKALKVQTALAQIVERTRERAACAIQNAWRTWWERIGLAKREVQRKRHDERLRQAYLHLIDPAFVKLVHAPTNTKTHMSTNAMVDDEDNNNNNIYAVAMPHQGKIVLSPHIVVRCGLKWLARTACVRYWRRFIFEPEHNSLNSKSDNNIIESYGNNNNNGDGGDTKNNEEQRKENWHSKSAQRALLLRDEKFGFVNEEYLRACVTRIQSHWRRYVAQSRYQKYYLPERNKSKEMQWEQKTYDETREYAALVIQCAIRKNILARYALERELLNRYEAPTRNIQRWYRHVLHSQQRRGVDGATQRKREWAAITIQSAWRMYVAKVTLYMSRLRNDMNKCALPVNQLTHNNNNNKKKMMMMINKVEESAIMIQRTCRGAKSRIVLGNYYHHVNDTTDNDSNNNNNNKEDDNKAEYFQECLNRAEQVRCEQWQERELYDVPLFYAPRAERERTAWVESIRLIPSIVAKERAKETIRDEVAQHAFVRQRAAVVIQRAWRQWRRICHDNFRDSTLLRLSRARYQQGEYERKIMWQQHKRVVERGRELYGDSTLPVHTARVAAEDELQTLQHESCVRVTSWDQLVSASPSASLTTTNITNNNVNWLPCRTRTERACAEAAIVRDEKLIHFTYPRDVERLREDPYEVKEKTGQVYEHPYYRGYENEEHRKTLGIDVECKVIFSFAKSD